MRYLFLLILITLAIPPPTYAADADLANASTVAYGLGSHSYILSGERWVYQDSDMRVTLTDVSGVNPGEHTKTVIVRWFGVTVAKWVNGVEVVFVAGDHWQTHLANLASGVGSK